MNLDKCLEIVCASDTGRVRSHNEDSTASDASLGLVILADGMGGYSAGEVASAIAVTRVFQDTRDGLTTLVPGQTDRESGLRYESLIVHYAVPQAKDEIIAAAAESAEYNGMGTTIVAVLFYDNRLTCAHAGDSRMYIWRNRQLRQLTDDHSVVREIVKSGMYSEDEARASFNPNLVTRALGADSQLEVDIHEHPVKPGDLYLVCSDGLTNMVNEDRIAKILMNLDNLDNCAQQLIHLANKGGGDDNISVALVSVKSEYGAEENWQTQMIDWFNP
jgi:serine/threonine protein phosphatase PrpC